MRQAVEQFAAELDELLPQLQCRRCGYPTCADFAEAIVRGRCRPNRCDPGGSRVLDDLNHLTGGTDAHLDPAYDTPSLPEAVIIEESECIGCTLCIKACPVDAIIGAAKLMHTVLSGDCTGCELCLPACPVDCIHPIKINKKESVLFQESLLARASFHRAHFRRRQARLGGSQKPRKTDNRLTREKTIADSVARIRGKREKMRESPVSDEKDTTL